MCLPGLVVCASVLLLSFPAMPHHTTGRGLRVISEGLSWKIGYCLELLPPLCHFIVIACGFFEPNIKTHELAPWRRIASEKRSTAMHGSI